MQVGKEGPQDLVAGVEVGGFVVESEVRYGRYAVVIGIGTIRVQWNAECGSDATV